MTASLSRPAPADATATALSAPLTARACDKDLQRAQGSGRIVLGGGHEGVRLIDLVQRAPIRVMFPKRGASAIEEAVLINTGGGIAGGDHLDFRVEVQAGASITVTSQAAEKVYRALSEPAHVSVKLDVGRSARLAWLPQETIAFDGARLVREMDITLTSGAEVLALEWLVLGRTAHGETLASGHLSDSWRVRHDGRLIWADTFRVSDETIPHIGAKPLLSHFRAIGTLVYFGPRLDTRLERLRAIAASLPCVCAATSVGGLIVVRFAARVSRELRSGIGRLLEAFGRELGPVPIQAPTMWSC